MKVLEFDKDFCEYEDRLRDQKAYILKPKDYIRKENAENYAFSALLFVGCIALILIGWMFV